MDGSLSIVSEENRPLLKSIRSNLNTSTPSDWSVILTESNNQISMIRDGLYCGKKYQLYYSNIGLGDYAIDKTVRLGDFFSWGCPGNLVFANEEAFNSWVKEADGTGYRSSNSSRDSTYEQGVLKKTIMRQHDDLGNRRVFYYNIVTLKNGIRNNLLIRCVCYYANDEIVDITFERDSFNRILKTIVNKRQGFIAEEEGNK